MARVIAFGDCEPLSGILRSQNYELLRAPGLSRALGLAKDLLPELVLVGTGAEADVKSALEIVARLANDPLARLLPVILVQSGAGPADPGLVRQGLDAGASDVVTRGMGEEELSARANAAVREKRAVEELVAEKQRLTLLELAGAVSHRINQPLTSMSIIVETLLQAHGRGDLSADRLATKLGELQRLVDRMAAIVKQVAGVVEYRTVDYVGDVRIIDLESGDRS